MTLLISSTDEARGTVGGPSCVTDRWICDRFSGHSWPRRCSPTSGRRCSRCHEVTARAPCPGTWWRRRSHRTIHCSSRAPRASSCCQASNSAGSSSGWPATSWNPAAGIGSWTRQPGAPSPTLTPGPGCASSDRTARLRWVRLFFVDGPRGFCQRHGKSYLTRRRRGGEGGGGGLLTGRAIPSAYRWAWCRWYSRVVEVPLRIEVAAGFVAPGASEPPRLQPSWPPGGSGPAHG